MRGWGGALGGRAVIHLLRIKSSHPIAGSQVSSGDAQQQLLREEQSMLSGPPARRGQCQLSDPVPARSLPSEGGVGTLKVSWGVLGMARGWALGFWLWFLAHSSGLSHVLGQVLGSRYEDPD